ncbi:VOC family protein [uncultured Brachyspira sp.]|uniref:VOC family protein n=1 Tax=uncultured Brachyspira sp. TaxID=221953 RepID=UPI002596CF3A|nr:VOC family protein [uncultured Brachyspira sp.]
MIREVMHIGITVSNIEKSIHFYKDILGLTFKCEAMMEGKETDLLFNMKGVKVKIAYLNGSDNIIAPPIELLQFINEEAKKDTSQLNKISISEICFRVENIDEMYKHLIKNNVECLSEPQYFDFENYGFGKSKALYFRDPDGIILELMENI